MDKMKVAVMNTSKEIIEVLQDIFEIEGYPTCSMFTYLFKENVATFDEFVRLNKPDVVIYDIAIPYKENYDLFVSLSQRPVSSKLPFILTCTNKAALEEIVGTTKTHELIGKPFDLEEILEAVKTVYAKNKSTSH